MLALLNLGHFTENLGFILKITEAFYGSGVKPNTGIQTALGVALNNGSHSAAGRRNVQ